MTSIYKIKNGLLATATNILHRRVTDRVFTSHFGTSVYVTAFVYYHKDQQYPNEGLSYLHFFMALYFLNAYSTETLNATKFSCEHFGPKTGC